MLKWTPKQHPWMPADWDAPTVYAFKAFSEGTANDSQQRLVWQYLQYLTGTGEFADMSFRPGGQDAERESAFAEGKRFVGLQLLKLLHPLTAETAAKEMADMSKKQVEITKPKRGKSK